MLWMPIVFPVVISDCEILSLTVYSTDQRTLSSLLHWVLAQRATNVYNNVRSRLRLFELFIYIPKKYPIKENNITIGDSIQCRLYVRPRCRRYCAPHGFFVNFACGCFFSVSFFLSPVFGIDFIALCVNAMVVLLKCCFISYFTNEKILQSVTIGFGFSKAARNAYK